MSLQEAELIRAEQPRSLNIVNFSLLGCHLPRKSCTPIIMRGPPSKAHECKARRQEPRLCSGEGYQPSCTSLESDDSIGSARAIRGLIKASHGLARPQRGTSPPQTIRSCTMESGRGGGLHGAERESVARPHVAEQELPRLHSTAHQRQSQDHSNIEVLAAVRQPALGSATPCVDKQQRVPSLEVRDRSSQVTSRAKKPQDSRSRRESARERLAIDNEPGCLSSLASLRTGAAAVAWTGERV